MVRKMISVSLISELGKVFIKMKKKLVVVGLVMLLVLQILSPTFAYAQGTTESTTQSAKKESLSQR